MPALLVRKGRMDLLVDVIADFVTVVEIKSTDRDKIENPDRLLRSHTQQVLKYVDKYLFGDEISVCAAIIYPKPPTSSKLRREIEGHHHANSLGVYWYDES